MINWEQLLNPSGSNTNPKPPPTPVQPALNPVGTATMPGGAFGFGPTGPGLAGLLSQMNNYVYSVPAGGYLTEGDARNANSYYNKFGAGGGGDPTANAAVRRIYAAIGELPTTANTSPALAQLNAASGAQPALGPSLNSRLAELMSGPNAEAARNAGFGPTFTGPWSFGRRMPGYNMWGSYKG